MGKQKLRHLHLHIGLPKCDSTFLQNFLSQNRAVLLDQGINYPDLGTGPAGNMTAYALSKRPKNWHRQTDFLTAQRFETAETCLRAAVEASSTQVVFLSSEALHHLDHKIDLQWLFDLFENVTVHVVFRPRAALLLAAYSQRVRADIKVEPLSEFLDDPDIKTAGNFSEQVSYWRSIVGKQSVQLHFLSPRFEDISTQLMKAIGVQDHVIMQTIAPQNKSLSAFVLCAAVYAKMIAPQNRQASTSDIIRQAKKFDPNPTISLLSPSIAQQIDNLYKKDTEKFVKLQTVISRADIETDPNTFDRPWTTNEAIIASDEFQFFANSLTS
ncbi:hypothetical protein [Sulfitobacter guttiformis]|uniref:Sulfotransferase family protein n=1 Tax=Sulfitobacter guttiformis TaxID=74349 RepID=A0A420DIX5_9RHOB|nr:hypothetical protein [Sulfitobacter guttiformis]RKE94186.1 hypothetical protein C8N30_3300 [Sulfitobacter guttiformis]